MLQLLCGAFWFSSMTRTWVMACLVSDEIPSLWYIFLLNLSIKCSVFYSLLPYIRIRVMAGLGSREKHCSITAIFFSIFLFFSLSISVIHITDTACPPLSLWNYCIRTFQLVIFIDSYNNDNKSREEYKCLSEEINSRDILCQTAKGR